MRDRFPEIFQLSPDEKCQLIQELTDDLAEQVEKTPLPEWALQELERRRAAYLQNPTDVLTWEEVEEDILSRHANETGNPAGGQAGHE
ncbi:MAG TPA: addiction module protein [Gemmataceae bacterium]|nr:addiction module protein [Gemmataceae bacterium]